MFVTLKKYQELQKKYDRLKSEYLKCVYTGKRMVSEQRLPSNYHTYFDEYGRFLPESEQL